MKSFIPVSAESHFPLQNLPYGVFKLKVGSEPVVGAAIGDYVLDLSVLEHKGLFKKTKLGSRVVFNKSSLNEFMSSGRSTWNQVRVVLQTILSDDNPFRDNDDLRKIAHTNGDVTMCLPADICDYTDFTVRHATNVELCSRKIKH
jgi:fumarylacetoacetase